MKIQRISIFKTMIQKHRGRENKRGEKNYEKEIGDLFMCDNAWISRVWKGK